MEESDCWNHGEIERIELHAFLNNNYFIEYEYLKQKQKDRETPFPVNWQGQPLLQRNPRCCLHSPTQKVRHTLGSKLTKNRSIIPTFNADKKYYTYAFQLPSSPVDNE